MKKNKLASTLRLTLMLSVLFVAGCSSRLPEKVYVKEPIKILPPETCDEFISFHNHNADFCMEKARNVEGVKEGFFHKPTYEECYPTENKLKVLQKIDELCPKKSGWTRYWVSKW